MKFEFSSIPFPAIKKIIAIFFSTYGRKKENFFSVFIMQWKCCKKKELLLRLCFYRHDARQKFFLTGCTSVASVPPSDSNAIPTTPSHPNLSIMVQAIASCLVRNVGSSGILKFITKLNCCMEPVSDSQSHQKAVLSGCRRLWTTLIGSSFALLCLDTAIQHCINQTRLDFAIAIAHDQGWGQIRICICNCVGPYLYLTFWRGLYLYLYLTPVFEVFDLI